MSHTIAFVDDDQSVLTSLSMTLEDEGFEVHTYANGSTALDGLDRKPVDLAILDVKMPRMDGKELFEMLRRTSNLPVIFLTAMGDEFDEILALRMGVDDYIKKPFSQRLLIERIRAVLRRHDRTVDSPEEKDEVMICGDLILDLTRHLCTWRDGKIDLTVTEFLLLQALTKRPGHVKSRDQLIDAAYGNHIYLNDRTIDSHIKRLRRKFKVVDPEFANIETLYGIGYRYRSD